MSESGAVTVVVGRFEPLVGRGLVDALCEDQRVSVLASDLDDDALGRVVAQRGPRVVVLGESVEYGLLAGLKLSQADTGVLVLANRPSRLLGTWLLDAGATCVARTAPAEDIIAAVHRAAYGEPTFLGSTGHVARSEAVDLRALTKRERQVLVLLTKGKRYSEIAYALHIAPETVRRHTRAICGKLNRTRLELVGMHVAR